MISTNKSTTPTVKFICSYGGKILPRPSDGLLRYVGGHTRVLSVSRSVSFSELLAKLSEMCGYSVALRCQLPMEEMDVLVSVKSDDDLLLVMDEYDLASLVAGKELKIRSVLSRTMSHDTSNSSSDSSSYSCNDFSPTKSSDADHCRTDQSFCFRRVSPPSSPNGFRFDRDPSMFQPCHVQAYYRPNLVHSNYKP